MSKYIIACGGTGGHLSPGLAIAEELIARNEDCLLLVSNKDIDNIMLKKYGQYRHFTIEARPFSKKAKNFYQFLKSHIISFFKCLKLLKTEKASAVIGMGGFTSLPIVMAAVFLRKKIILHESNRVVGKSIYMLSYFAHKIFLPEKVFLKPKFLNKKVISAQVPLRREIVKSDKNSARKTLGFGVSNFVVTVVGGSQGAEVLNQWAKQNFKTLNANNIAVCCVQGPKQTEETIIGTTNLGEKINNIFLSFCDTMPLILSATDLLICRAGAGTIAEANHFALPMILIPYPYAAGDHQVANAVYEEQSGSAIVVKESNLKILTDLVLGFFNGNFNKLQCNQHRNDSSLKVNGIVDHIQNLVNKS